MVTAYRERKTLSHNSYQMATNPRRWQKLRKSYSGWASCQRELDVKKLEREADRLACVSHHGFGQQRALTWQPKRGSILIVWFTIPVLCREPQV